VKAGRLEAWRCGKCAKRVVKSGVRFEISRRIALFNTNALLIEDIAKGGYP
jgi:hypothetical protein